MKTTENDVTNETVHQDKKPISTISIADLVQRDADGKPTKCFSTDQAKEFLYTELSKCYGVDFKSL